MLIPPITAGLRIFLCVVSRMPTQREMINALHHIMQATTRSDGAQDLLWALLNSPAFLFNR